MQPGLTGFSDQTDQEEAAGGYPGLYWGEVVDNQDPKKMGRVKVHVHGVTVKATDWAFPVGMPGAGYAKAGAGKGGFFVPRVGATVLVGFIYGKLEEPIYFCGHYPQKGGADCTPRIVSEQTVQEAPNVRVLAETESFEIYIVDTATEKKIVVQTLGGTTGIEIDANDGSLRLKASRTIILEAPLVDVDGLNVVLKKRPVSPLGLSI